MASSTMYMLALALAACPVLANSASEHQKIIRAEGSRRSVAIDVHSQMQELEVQNHGATDTPLDTREGYGSMLQHASKQVAVEPDAKSLTDLQYVASSEVFFWAPCLDGTDRCHSSKQRLSPEMALRTYQLTNIVTQLLHRHKVWHVGMGGTLLGAVRNKGIIPHDNDVDFDILKSPGGEIIESEAFKQDLAKNALYLSRVEEDFWKVRFIDENPSIDVDLFALVTIGDILTHPENKWPGTEWPVSIMEPGGVVEWPFGSGTVPAPARAVSEAGLTKKFGSDWITAISCKDTYHACVGVADVHYDLTGRTLPDSPLVAPI